MLVVANRLSRRRRKKTKTVGNTRTKEQEKREIQTTEDNDESLFPLI